jgi:hypothetical protein
MVDYSLSIWADPYGQAFTLVQNLTAGTLTLTEPGGRWIEIYNPNAVTKVTTSDGQTVTFSYKTWTLKTRPTSELWEVRAQTHKDLMGGVALFTTASQARQRFAPPLRATNHQSPITNHAGHEGYLTAIPQGAVSPEMKLALITAPVFALYFPTVPAA